MKNLYLSLTGLLIINCLHAQTPELFANLNQDVNEGSRPEYFVLFNELIYFTAKAGTDDYVQVWFTDGISVEAIEGLPSGYDFARITKLSDRIMFEGESDTDEKQFFYDGTNLTSFDIVVNRGIEYQGDIYFLGETPELGQELFRYDGTDTTLVADIRPGSQNSGISDFVVFNNKLLFTGNDGTNGKLLWEYNGTSVQLIDDINPGFTNTSYGEFAIVGSNLFFAGSSANNGFELYRYDGEDVTLFEINPGVAGSSPEDFFVFEDQLIFRASTENEGVEMFVHNGSTLTNLNINKSGSSSPHGFTLFNGKVYFSANDGINGDELWAYDGTIASLAADINLGPGNSEIEDPFANGPYLYFKAYNFDRPSEAYREQPLNTMEELSGLFRFDGENFDFIVPEIDYEFDDRDGILPIILDNYVYFRADSGTSGDELFRMRAISEEAEITEFTIAEQVEDAVINTETRSVSVLVPAGTDVSNLTPTINISEFAEINLSEGQDLLIRLFIQSPQNLETRNNGL